MAGLDGNPCSRWMSEDKWFHSDFNFSVNIDCEVEQKLHLHCCDKVAQKTASMVLLRLAIRLAVTFSREDDKQVDPTRY